MILILHNVRSLHNVGSLLRTSDAAGVSKIYLSGITSAPTDILGHPRSQITKVSLGAENSIPWEKLGNSVSPQPLLKLVKQLHEEKYVICALEQSKTSTPYTKLSQIKNDKLALIVGNEVKGLSPSILKTVDYIVEIPMRGHKESLNVSVAAGIALFEAVRKL